MEERSLRITGTDKNFINKLTSKISKILIPTKIGINGMLISMKRNTLVKAYEHFKNNSSLKDKELEEKYDRAYEAYLESIDKYVMDSIYKKVRGGIANEFEKNAMYAYYEVTSLKENQYVEYKNRKQKYLIELDYEGLKLNKKENSLERYNKFYIEKMDNLYKAILKNYSVKIADTTNAYESSKEGIYTKIFSTLEEYIQNILVLKIEKGLEENQKDIIREYEKYEEYSIGKLDQKDSIEKNTVLLGISRKLFTHSLPLIVASQCYEKLLKDARILVQDNKISTKREKSYALLLFLMEDYNVKLLSTKVYWEDNNKRDEFKVFWNKYKEISKLKEDNFSEYIKQKEILFIKNDINKIEHEKENEKIDYSRIIKYYKRKLIDYRALREFKNTVNSNGKYINKNKLVKV